MGSKSVAYGGVVIDGRGRILLREPSGHFGGYTWMFPKGRARQGESEEQVALREVWEETGVVAEVVSRIDGLFEGDTTWNTYFLMRPTGRADEPRDDETASVCWAGSPQKARELIEENGSAKHRESLLAVLDAALELRSQLPEPPSAEVLVIEARGRPPVPRKGGSGDDAEWQWRTHLAKRVRETMLGRPPFPRTEWFSVQLDFFLARLNTDLDNLVKPVMDTLFRPGVDNPNQADKQDIIAALFANREDWEVRELILRKHETREPGKQGVRVSVRALPGAPVPSATESSSR